MFEPDSARVEAQVSLPFKRDEGDSEPQVGLVSGEGEL